MYVRYLKCFLEIPHARFGMILLVVHFLILSYCSPVLGELSKGLRGSCIYIIAFFLCSSTCCMYSSISSVRDLMIATTPEQTNW